MLIDTSYFTAGPRHILNATLGTMSSEVNDAIHQYIATLQMPFLVELLGEDVGNELHSYLCEKEEGDSDFTEDDALESLCKRIDQSFADYVFFHILRDNTQATITGLVRLKNANTYVAPIDRQVTVWNRMVERNIQLAKWSKSEQCDVSGIEVSSNLIKPINRFNL